MYINVNDKEFAIRAAEPGDAPSANQVGERCFIKPWPYDLLEQHCRPTAAHMGGLVATYFGLVVGFAFFEVHAKERELYVSYVGVDPSYQRAGVAKAMMRRLIEIRSQWGCEGLRLHCAANEEAPQRTYLAVGFRVERTVQGLYGEFGDALEMALSG